MRSHSLVLRQVLAFVLFLTFGAGIGTISAQEEIPTTIQPRASGRVAVLIELADPPAARVYGEVLQSSKGSLAEAQAAAVAAAEAQIRKIVPAQERVMAAVPSSLRAVEIYRVQKAYNGIALEVDSARIGDLRRIRGVKAVHVLELEFPTNSTSVPFLGAPNLWGDTLGVGQDLTGSGITIGVIDTGVDYLHSHFGGLGLLADYTANDRTVAPDAYFPTAKVAGGFDFAGDAYTGGNVPAPDNDPMDCNGHGSHVAGTAAGFGVNADGTTYAGPYDGGAPFGTFRIGPGTAPQATLYALRVFGCTGATNLTVQAIDWAMDPNNDNDLSDHLDVINMSLGSNYGRVSNATAVASDNAALAGVIVVTSAGNAGDTFFITGSPGVAGRAIATAASVDSGIAGAILQVNTPPAIAGNYAASAANSFAPAPAPAPSGQTATVVLALDLADGAGPLTTDGCSPLTNAAAVLGNIALVDRGTCGFQIKANNAQAAGAIGVIIANNIPGDPNLIAMGATGVVPVTVPTIMISFNDRNTIVANLPANATLGAATAADTLAGFSSRGPRLASSPVRLKPDIAAPGLNITSTQTGFCNSTCLRDPATPNGAFIPGNAALTISGTSMASPHMAGIMALLLQEHPDWSVEQLKALAMNGALHDVTLGANGSGPQYGPGRIGAGRVDPSNSAQAEVIALNADEAGLVSLSFESTSVVGTTTEVKSVRLVNTGTSSATYDLAIDTPNDAPGIAFSLPAGSSVTIPGGDAVEIDVQMDANALLMDHVREASISPLQAAPGALAGLGNVARHWMTEEAGYLVLSQGGVDQLRLPLYLTSRPASTMTAPATITTGGAGTGSTTIPLSGTDVCTGTLAAGPICNGTFPNDEASLVTPFELQVVSERDTLFAPPYADLQYAGVAFNAGLNLVMFGVSTWGDWSSPTDTTFNIYIDNNEDGTWDRILFNSNLGTMASYLFGNVANGQDTFTNAIFNIATNGVSIGGAGFFLNRQSPAAVDSALFNSNVAFLSATPAQLGLPGGDTTFRYRIVTCPGFLLLCQEFDGFWYDEEVGPFFWNFNAQGLDFSGTNTVQDLNGSTLPVTWNTANMTTNGSLGALLLHHHNDVGQRAEVVVLDTAANTDLAIAKAVAPPNPTLGQNVTFTVTVTNNGSGAATGVVVTDELPAGLTYVSDDGGGSYDPALGTWTVGALAVSASATLNIVATVETTEEVCNLAQITSVTPVDTIPANDDVTVCVMAPRSSDLALGMIVSAPTVLVGGSVTFTITVTNNGDEPAYAVDVQESFPAFPLLNPVSFVASQGSYNPATGLWNLAALNPGNSATLAITVTAPNTAGPLTNQGTAAANTSDPNTANNTASATTTVLSPASIAATKTVAGPFNEGNNVTYTIVLSNSAAFDQQNNAGPELTDVLPAALTLVSASATSGTAVANVGTNTVTWDGVVPAGGSVTITIQATIEAGTSGQQVGNQASFIFDADGNGINEAGGSTDDPGAPGAADATIFIVASPATISGGKTVTGSFTPGGVITYTIVMPNTSAFAQQDNPGNEFIDILPPTLMLLGANATSGTIGIDIPTRTVTWNGAIPAAGSVTITIQAQISNLAGGQTISNQGTINFDSDGNGTNDSSVQTDDPALPGGADPTSFLVLSLADIPTLGQIGLLLLILMMTGAAMLLFRRQNA
ncbi:MAG TPA: S8 family serine peptidase [Thermoanaerobaculia bacterium]|nr:S8 family serine peptidase [Thermoanaerobaculia bacterium]